MDYTCYFCGKVCPETKSTEQLEADFKVNFPQADPTDYVRCCDECLIEQKKEFNAR